MPKPLFINTSTGEAEEQALALSVADNAGAVILQGSTPGTAQTGNVNVTGTHTMEGVSSQDTLSLDSPNRRALVANSGGAFPAAVFSNTSTGTAIAAVALNSNASTMIIQGTSGQTTALLDAQDNSATTVARINMNGTINGRTSPNYIRNGRMDIIQRFPNTKSRTLALSTTQYTLDSYRTAIDGSGGVVALSQQAFAVNTIPSEEPKNFLRWNQTTAGTLATANQIMQAVEDVRTLAGLDFTFSFWATINSGATSKVISVVVQQYFNNSGGGSATVSTINTTKTLTSSWAKYSVSGTFGSMSGKTLAAGHSILITLFLPNNQVQTVDTTLWQLEEGKVPSPFKRRSEAEELVLCQRYYQRSGDDSIDTGQFKGLTGAYEYTSLGASVVQTCPVQLSPSMYAAPSITIDSPSSASASTYCTTGAGGNNTSTTVSNIGNRGFTVTSTTNATVGTLGGINAFHWQAAAEIV